MGKTPLYIIWNDDNHTNVSIVDEQHRGIISTINTIHYSIQKNHGPELLNPTLMLMKTYIGLHLKTEEMLLEEAAYPVISKIKTSRQEFMKNLDGAIKQATIEPEQFLKFITSWWLNHIKQEHKQYAEHLN